MMDKEKTFIGEDGLIYCSVCKEPKQAWLPENNLLGVRIRYRQCACERDANAMKKAEQEEKERRVFILARMYRCSGGTDTAVPAEGYRQTGTGYRRHHAS